MLATTHTITSAALGSQMQSPALAFGAAFLLHLLTDSLLHWNIYIDRHRWPYLWVALDVVGGLAVTSLLLPQRFFTLPVLAAIVGGNLPDIWGGLWDLAKVLSKKTYRSKGAFLRFHNGLQHETISPVKGLAWQVLLVALAVFFLRQT